jgi:hypothetical protein
MPGQKFPVSLQQARPFIEAHLRGDLERVRQLLAELPALERFPPRHGTWLHESAAVGSVPLVEFWLARGLDVNLNLPDLDPNTDGVFTPLHAAKNGAVAQLLIDRGAFVNTWEKTSGSALHRAVVMKDMKLLRALLDAGADPSIGDADGLAPLGVAVKYKQREAEKLLRSIGAPTHANPPSGRAIRRPPTIDLREDLKRITAMLAAAVDRFAIEHRGEVVTAIAVAASGIEGYVMVGFDTKEFLGSPWDVTYHEFATTEFDDWRQAYQLADQGVHITTIDGSPFDYGGSRRGDTLFQEPFFRACIAALRALECAPQVAKLTRAEGFQIGVEISTGDHAEYWKPNP